MLDVYFYDGRFEIVRKDVFVFFSFFFSGGEVGVVVRLGGGARQVPFH
jgi:hypothetical protein